MGSRWEPAPDDEPWARAIGGLIALLVIAAALIVLLGITAVEPVDAGDPDHRCKACSTATPAPTVRPTPIVVGIPSSTPAAPTLPPTDAE
jgi:hypothetical protein